MILSSWRFPIVSGDHGFPIAAERTEKAQDYPVRTGEKHRRAYTKPTASYMLVCGLNGGREESIMRKIIIHLSDPDEEVPYWVECPSLGVASMGESIDDAIRMIREAISLHIEDLVAHGEPIPPVDSESIPNEQSLVLDI